MNIIDEILSLQSKINDISNSKSYFIGVKHGSQLIIEVKCYNRSRPYSEDHEHYFEYNRKNKELKYYCSGMHVNDEESVTEAKEFMKNWLH